MRPHSVQIDDARIRAPGAAPARRAPTPGLRVNLTWLKMKMLMLVHPLIADSLRRDVANHLIVACGFFRSSNTVTPFAKMNRRSAFDETSLRSTAPRDSASAASCPGGEQSEAAPVTPCPVLSPITQLCETTARFRPTPAERERLGALGFARGCAVVVVREPVRFSARKSSIAP